MFSCGFCGEAGHTIFLINTTHKTVIPGSNYSKRVKFSIKAAESAKGRNPCSNRPVKCELCKAVYWSYAMERHYSDSHHDHVCPVIVSEEEKQLVLAKK